MKKLRMLFIILVTFMYTKSYICLTVNNERNVKTYFRKPKFWSWGMGFVRFENSVCTGIDGLDGTCYTKRQCSNIRGLNSGKCAQIGACCVVQRTCGATTSYNNTYFVNPSFPRPFAGGSSCTLTIQKCHAEICQVRIDFLSLTLSQPNAIGRCVNDALTISGASSQIPPICGENSGQHIYLDFNGNEEIRIVIDANSAPFTRSWKLKISQIGCDSPNKAPSGCLMYYTDISRIVQSFNYGSTESGQTTAQGLIGTRQLVNQNYGICISMAPGYCSIDWQLSQSNSFTLSDNTPANSDILGTPAAGVAGINCTSDFIIIPNPQIGTMLLNYDRFCGNGLPIVTTFSKPFVLTVVTDNDELNDEANRGFSLDYTQRRCSSLITQ